MKHHVEFEHLVPFPLERVFACFSNPENLPHIMPAAGSTRLIAFNRTPPPRRQLKYQARRPPALVRALSRLSVCFRFCRSAAGGWRGSQNLNGTATSPTCRRKVHSRDGITGTSLRARGRSELKEQQFATWSITRWVSDSSARSPTHSSFARKCKAHSPNGRGDY
jgi:hypothetical protein